MSNKVAKATVILMMITLLAKVLGFIRETILVGVYGPGTVSDAYITSMNIPLVLFTTIGAALVTTFIPLFVEIEHKDGEEKSLKFANNVFNIVIILSIVLACVGFVFAQPLTKLFAVNFTGDRLNLATDFTRIMIIGMVFISLSNIMTCWLQIKGNFTIPGLTSLPNNIIIIISIFLSRNGNLNILAYGALVGMASQFLFQYPYAKKLGYKYIPYINFKDKNIKRLLFLVIPVFIGVGVTQINAVVDRSLVSTLGKGFITILNSAYKLNGFVQGIFIATITAVIYPLFSKLSTSGNDKELTISIKKSLNTIILLIIPISVGAIVLAEPIVRIVFERGQFNSDATELTASALVAYSIGMVAFSLNDVLGRVFYAIKDTKTPVINGAICVVTNIIMSFILIKYIGHIGPALATSIASCIGVVLMLICLKRKISYFGQDKILQTLIKCVVSAVVMGLGSRVTYNIVSSIMPTRAINNLISLGTAVFVGAFIYGALVLVLKVEEIDEIVNLIKNKINKKNK